MWLHNLSRRVGEIADKALHKCHAAAEENLPAVEPAHTPPPAPAAPSRRHWWAHATPAPPAPNITCPHRGCETYRPPDSTICHCTKTHELPRRTFLLRAHRGDALAASRADRVRAFERGKPSPLRWAWTADDDKGEGEEVMVLNDEIGRPPGDVGVRTDKLL